MNIALECSDAVLTISSSREVDAWSLGGAGREDWSKAI
jgi:hypothetical protein